MVSAIPPNAGSPLLAAILLAIGLARDTEALAMWWAVHKPALRRLEPAELAEAIAAKDRRKAALAPLPLPGATPPAAILPPARPAPWPGPRLL